MKRRVLDPIGLEVARWARDAAGNPATPYGAILTAREWEKFGELLRNGGGWQGKQIVSKASLDECVKGSRANPAYGLTFWLNVAPGNGAQEIEAADAAGRPQARSGLGKIAGGTIPR